MATEDDLVAVSTFRSVADAQVARGLLEQIGVESLIRSDNAGGMYPALDSVALLVRSDDLARASEALDQRSDQETDPATG